MNFIGIICKNWMGLSHKGPSTRLVKLCHTYAYVTYIALLTCLLFLRYTLEKRLWMLCLIAQVLKKADVADAAHLHFGRVGLPIAGTIAAGHHPTKSTMVPSFQKGELGATALTVSGLCIRYPLLFAHNRGGILVPSIVSTEAAIRGDVCHRTMVLLVLNPFTDPLSNSAREDCSSTAWLDRAIKDYFTFSKPIGMRTHFVIQVLKKLSRSTESIQITGSVSSP